MKAKSENMKNDKVCLLISSLAGGGAEGVCVNIANGLAERGADVTLVVLNLDNADYLSILSDDVKLVSLDVRQARHALVPLRTFIKNSDIEKWLAFNYELTMLLVILRCTLLKKYTIISRNINTISRNTQDIKGFLGKFVVVPLIKLLYGRADHIVNQCAGMRDDLVKTIPSTKSKTSVIYNPVSSKVESFSQSFPEEVKKENYILCVGRLEKQKAFHCAIDAFSIVAKSIPDVSLVFIGQGSLLGDLQKQVGELGLSEKVMFEGFQPDTIGHYNKARLTLMTSLYEGFPNVLVESITLGTPVVSFDCPSGPSEIIVNNRNGAIVEQRDVQILATAIMETYRNPPPNEVVKETARRYQRASILESWERLLFNA